MTYFILQTLFWLLLAFIAGLILGRWLKRLLCHKVEPDYQYSSSESVHKATDSTDSTYVGTADKLAFRDRGEYDSQSTQQDGMSTGTKAAAGIATAAVTAAVGRSLVDDDEKEVEKEEVIVEKEEVEVEVIAEKEEKTVIETYDEDTSDGASTFVDVEEEVVEIEEAATTSTTRTFNVDTGTTGNDSTISGIDSNNLQIIEGIGPKMQEILNENGVHNWKGLSMTSEEDIRNMLSKYGDQFKGVEDIDSWIEQARLATEGDIDELIRIQKVDGSSKLERKFGITGSNQGTDTTTRTDESTDNDLGGAGAVGAAGAAVSGAAAQGLMGSHDEQSSSSGIDGIDSDNNLQIIEGIGPAMERVLNENGINSWSDLGSRTEDDILEILGKYGNKYQLMQPASWVAEAKLAAAGDVTELIRIQKIDGTSKLENMIRSTIESGFGNFDKDDLQIVEGIGPKISGLLNNAGINTWQALADTDVGKIQGILDSAGSDFQVANPTTWAEQAGLAANEEWDKLKEYQDFLDGGRSV
ncbi:MAG: helix-hairpin-helix domain-containing protein [Thiotrichaceae bacterium]